MLGGRAFIYPSGKPQPPVLPTFVQGNTAKSAASATTLSVTLPATVGNGNAILVAVWYLTATAGQITSVTDDKSNTYNVETSNVSAAAGGSMYMYGVGNVTNGPKTVTVNISANTIFMAVVEYNQVVALANPVDAAIAAGASVVPSGADAITSNSASTTQTNETLVGFTCSTSGAAATITNGTGYTTEFNDATNKVQVEDRSQLTAASVQATFSLSAGGGSYMTGMLSLRSH